MKRKVILFAAVILTLCCTEGCQKQIAGNLAQESVTNSGIEIKNEADSQASSENAVATDITISLDENRIIQDQSFQAELNDWGEVKFVSYSPEPGADFDDVSFYLMKDNKVIYTFPYYEENNKTDNYWGLFDSVESVAFRDVNGDKLKDVIVIINYIAGAGPQGMEPRPKARIFLAGRKDFLLAKNMTDDVNDHIEDKDMSMDLIYEYLENK